MHAGIVGMGVMGRLLALALHNANWQVTLFDHNNGDAGCSLAAAGLLTPFSELDRASLLVFHLGQESICTSWPRILEQLSSPIYFQKSGSIVLNHPSDKAEWNHFNQRISTQLAQNDSYFRQLTNDALTQLEPDLSRFETAYYFPDEAHIDCQSFMFSLKTYLENKCVKFFANTAVLSIEPGLIVTESESHEFDMVFDCRGLGANSIFNDLRALRGELIWLYAPDVHLHRPIRLLHPRYSLYIVPRPDNIYLIGASEIEAEDYSPISVRTTLELLTAAYYVHAGFSEARIIKTVVHCRPTLLNHLPRIKFADGLIAVNGLYRHGYLIAPALAEEILRSLKTDHQNLCYPEIWENYYG
ncbi:FAD-dependent oxidoreductase [Legionella brunensis]|uniref:D-amino-acid oxidase n=1 Tax=Legionella brunensis TaxID=29422 RepID=A0A0W0S603_9GAMM|nr:FAD-dependent oxidoreductase [Legionella brunensis]KTC78357.1 thiamine biosynthesis oxidoreductase ThiO [Legionella brunensis]